MAKIEKTTVKLGLIDKRTGRQFPFYFTNPKVLLERYRSIKKRGVDVEILKVITREREIPPKILEKRTKKKDSLDELNHEYPWDYKVGYAIVSESKRGHFYIDLQSTPILASRRPNLYIDPQYALWQYENKVKRLAKFIVEDEIPPNLRKIHLLEITTLQMLVSAEKLEMRVGN